MNSKKAPKLNVLYEENLPQQVYDIWIGPEIKRRIDSGKNPNLPIKMCLIRLPKQLPPIVEFNDETKWLAVSSIREDNWKVGQPVFMHDVQEIISVHPPEVNGKRVAFVYMYWTGIKDRYNFVFDFSPNQPDYIEEKIEPLEWQFGKEIATSLKVQFNLKDLFIDSETETKLNEIGLWQIPSLSPYPLNVINIKILNGDVDSAKKELMKFCNHKFIDHLVGNWWSVASFNNRKEFLLEGIDSHKNRKFNSSINTLIPQVEGVITDWNYELSAENPEIRIAKGVKNKARQLKELTENNQLTSIIYKKIVEATTSFMLTGPIYATFNDWHSEVSSEFPSRHLVAHGKVDTSVYIEENSLKLILLFDTINYIIRNNIKAIEK